MRCVHWNSMTCTRYPYVNPNIKMIFNIKMMTLTRRVYLVARGYRTDPQKESLYSSVTSRESVRLDFLAAALNVLDTLAADIQNVYIYVPAKEKIYIICGSEFVSNKDCPALIVKTLYRLEFSRARSRYHLGATLRDISFKSCLTDPDVWMRPYTKSDVSEYW